jgi:hypothetical protein
MPEIPFCYNTLCENFERHIWAILAPFCRPSVGVSSVVTKLEPEQPDHETATGSLFAAILVATAGSELVAPDAFSAQPGPELGTEQLYACRSDDAEGSTRLEATERILAQGYSEISQLSKGCDNVWHALAFAEGDPSERIGHAAGRRADRVTALFARRRIDT